MNNILSVIGLITLWIYRYEVLSVLETLVDLYLSTLYHLLSVV
jgi:hypothetical protein